jgi:hypothetical protein
MLKTAVRWRLIRHNPVREIDRPRLDHPESQILDTSEIHASAALTNNFKPAPTQTRNGNGGESPTPSPSPPSGPACAAARPPMARHPPPRTPPPSPAAAVSNSAPALPNSSPPTTKQATTHWLVTLSVGISHRLTVKLGNEPQLTIGMGAASTRVSHSTSASRPGARNRSGSSFPYCAARSRAALARPSASSGSAA